MDIVIFGLGQQSSLAWYVFSHDSPHRVVGFAVDAAYRDRDRHHDLPVVDFEQVDKAFPAASHAMSIPLGWRAMNGLRAEKMAQARRLGYGFASYVSTRAQVWPDLRIGENCLVLDNVNISPFARIGDNCNIRTGAVISHHARIGDHSFVAAGALIAGNVTVGNNCVLGMGSIIRDDITLAPRCFIGAGAVVVADTEENGVYVGVPARRQARTADQLMAAG